MRNKFEWWQRIALFLILVQAALYFIPQFRPGTAGLICWMVGSDPVIWWALVFLMLLWGVIQSVVRRPFWNRRRAAGFAFLLVLAYTPFTFRVYPSSHDFAPSQVAFRIPLDGPVTVAWGGATQDVNYHTKAPDQRWAYDLFVTKDGQSYRTDGTQVEDYYCYGMPILAPADGVVHDIETGMANTPIGDSNVLQPGGNLIVMEVAPKQYLFLCHLMPDSIEVREGDTVKQGQTVARVGNTGNTSEPHLHVHLQDTPMLHLGEAIPMRFHNYRVDGVVVEAGIPTGGYDGGFNGQIVEHAG